MRNYNQTVSKLPLGVMLLITGDMNASDMDDCASWSLGWCDEHQHGVCFKAAFGPLADPADESREINTKWETTKNLYSSKVLGIQHKDNKEEASMWP